MDWDVVDHNCLVDSKYATEEESWSSINILKLMTTKIL